MNSSAAPKIRVILADDHELIRAALKNMLSRIEGVQLVAEASNGNELVELAAHLEPDVVMTDISMPQGDGLAAIELIHAAQPEIHLVVLSMHEELHFVRRAIAAGASGYLLKNASAFELEQAVRTVVATGRYFSQQITQALLDPRFRPEEEELTKRQIEIVTLVAQGKASKEIAFALGLSSKTVDVHRARIMQRLKLTDVASLTKYAVRTGLVKL